jgi:hypothetical protein
VSVSVIDSSLLEQLKYLIVISCIIILTMEIRYLILCIVLRLQGFGVYLVEYYSLDSL